jgi:hypothetical protein
VTDRLKELTLCNWFAGQLKDATSEQIKHGGCLGLGLAAMGTHRADVYEQLKFCLYQVAVTFNRSLQYLQTKCTNVFLGWNQPLFRL